MHCIINTHRQKAWDDGVAPSVYARHGEYIKAVSEYSQNWIPVNRLWFLNGDESAMSTIVIAAN